MHSPPRSFLAENSPDNGPNTVRYCDHTFHHALKSGEITISLKSFGRRGERGAYLPRSFNEMRSAMIILYGKGLQSAASRSKQRIGHPYMTMVKSPPPKAPWQPRKMINCNIVCASAQANEKLPAQAVNTQLQLGLNESGPTHTVNIATATSSTILRPKMSLIRPYRGAVEVDATR
jgi:hypothetical protein